MWKCFMVCKVLRKHKALWIWGYGLENIMIKQWFLWVSESRWVMHIVCGEDEPFTSSTLIQMFINGILGAKSVLSAGDMLWKEQVKIPVLMGTMNDKQTNKNKGELEKFPSVKSGVPLLWS